MKKEKQTIVLADDDKWLVDLYGEKLRLEGFVVYAAHSGKAGYSLALKHRPDLVLSDVVMADGDGFYLLKKMKENPATEEIPVISLTNLSNEQDKQALFDLGASDYLVKADFTPSQVVERIRKLIERLPERGDAGVTIVRKAKSLSKA